MASVAAFVTSLIFNGVIAFIILIIYSILRPKYDYVYQPNFKRLTEFLHNKIPERKLSLLRKMTLSSSFFAWIGPAFRVHDNELYELVGFDAFVYLRFIRLCFKVAAFALPYAAVVLIPVNVVDGKGISGMDRLTMGNVAQESHKLWAHLIGVWLFSFLLYYLLYTEWQIYVKYRQRYLKEKLNHHYSVLVTQLPAEVSYHYLHFFSFQVIFNFFVCKYI